MITGNMFAATESPLTITPVQLDDYLAKGWFRMNQTIFTTHFLQFNNIFYSAIWLRINISNYAPGGNHRALIKGIKNFRTEIQPAEITLQHEALYEKYKTGISFDAYSSLQQLLCGSYTYNIYNTWQVNIYDGRVLIASGFFDMGKTSAEGIVSIYHPDYKKYSLGKCLIYSKVDYCRQQGLLFFYPGYAVPGYAAFDYKLSIGAQSLQYYNKAISQWLPYNGVQAMYKPLTDMLKHLETLHTGLQQKNMPCQLFYYRFFDAALNINLWTTLLDYPVFLLLFKPGQNDSAVNIIIFNIVSRQYILCECFPLYAIDYSETTSTTFSSDVLSVHRELYNTPYPADMIDAITIFNRTWSSQFSA
jgi:arginine-tRNA-protein transferase